MNLPQKSNKFSTKKAPIFDKKIGVFFAFFSLKVLHKKSGLYILFTSSAKNGAMPYFLRERETLNALNLGAFFSAEFLKIQTRKTKLF